MAVCGPDLPRKVPRVVNPRAGRAGGPSHTWGCRRPRVPAPLTAAAPPHSQGEAAPGPRQRDRHHRRAGVAHLPAGEDAALGALPGRDLRPPAVLRCRLLPPDEREEAHLDVPRVRQASPLRPAHHRRVRRQGAGSRPACQAGRPAAQPRGPCGGSASAGRRDRCPCRTHSAFAMWAAV